MKRLPWDMNTFLELKVGLAKHFPRISSLTPVSFPGKGWARCEGYGLKRAHRFHGYRNFVKGIDCVGVLLLRLALLFLGWGVTFVSLLGIPAPAMNREN